ncbi:MAG TPA: metal ABC transporter permease [Phototrophicaceae bacterium]|jgi:ABC-type Mn2+/Zn2+ transport system permease subunit|nr:metal ABC transporter permease [Phototrophicaceae bacterium]
MSTLFEIVSPSYLLFPALVGTLMMGLVCPLIGSYLVLRRTVFLGLTLPEIAAAGVAFTFWLQQLGWLPQIGQGERGIAMIGSLTFTFIGMGLLGYLEQRSKGLAEGRLAAAYAFAGAVTILFMVFNPAGQIEVLNLLKGEVIALSKGELRLLTGVLGLVFVAMLIFRREFLLTSFDRDLAFLLKGRQVIWDVSLYLLAGLVIAFGVIMAGPLLIFGFLVLPALAAKPLVQRMSSYLMLSSMLGLAMAFFGFYSSVRLDLPLGPTDVTLGCMLIFFAYGLRRVSPKTFVALTCVCVAIMVSACGTQAPGPSVPDAKTIHADQIWLAKVKNSTALPLLLPSNNPLRSLAEMAGKISPEDYRQSVMDLLRQNLQSELGKKGFQTSLTEEKDARFPPLPSDSTGAARIARDGKLSGIVFVSEIFRWEGETQKYVRALIDFKLIRIDDGAVIWQRRVQGAIPTPSATNLGQASTDAAGKIVRDLFAG